MIHPATELRFVSETKGFGVFATEPIPQGTIVWVRDRYDQVLPTHAARRLPAELRDTFEKYTYRDGTGRLVLCWDIARYVNHSCDPNCMLCGDRFEIAVLDIPAGAELTNDYANLNVDDDGGFVCHCRSPRCRSRVTRDDAPALSGRWEVQVRSAMQCLDAVPQPLWALLAAEVLAQEQARLGLESAPLRKVYR